MTKAILIKEGIKLGLAYSFRGLAHYHCRDHGGTHVGTLAESYIWICRQRKRGREEHSVSS